MKELTCIGCPRGCTLKIERDGDGWSVTGNTCPRGREFAVSEMTAPKRMVTSSVPVDNGNYKTVSVKTSVSIPKELIFESLAALNGVKLTAPVKIGDAVVKNVLGTGADFVATRNVEKA